MTKDQIEQIALKCLAIGSEHPHDNVYITVVTPYSAAQDGVAFIVRIEAIVSAGDDRKLSVTVV